MSNEFFKMAIQAGAVQRFDDHGNAWVTMSSEDLQRYTNQVFGCAIKSVQNNGGDNVEYHIEAIEDVARELGIEL